MSMFTLNGVVINVFTAPKGVSKKTGEEYGGQDKVQIMGDIPLSDGGYRKELIDLTTDQGHSLKQMEGKSITCPVSFFASGRSVVFFIPSGHKITLTKPALSS
jgi:hypothetical protein